MNRADNLRKMETRCLDGVRNLIEAVREMGCAPIDAIMDSIECSVREAVQETYAEMMAAIQSDIDGTLLNTSEAIARMLEDHVTISGPEAARKVREAARETLTETIN